jgi:hypothetical protein
MHGPGAITCRIVNLRMKETIVLEDKEVMLFVRAHPNVFRLDDPRLDVVQKPPHFTKVVNNLRRFSPAMTYEQPLG